MKKLVLSLAIFTSVFAFSQKQDVNAQIQTINKAAMDAYNGKNYAAAAPKFMELYDVLKANGQDNKIYKYYSGLSLALAGKNAEAITIYNDLVNSGFTGMETKYTAKEKKSGETVELDHATWELMKKKGGDYSDFRMEQTGGVEAELYETLSTLLLTEKKNDEALSLINKGLAKFPNSAKLKEARGTALYASGKTDEFVASLKEQLSKNPNDATNWYNLGVMQSKNQATVNDAIASFQKAIELNPTFNNAYQNLVYTAIGDDETAVKAINEARKTNPDKATEFIEARRARFAKALPYAEKWNQAIPNDKDVLIILREIYVVTKNNDKAAEIKKKLDTMK